MRMVLFFPSPKSSRGHYVACSPRVRLRCVCGALVGGLPFAEAVRVALRVGFVLIRSELRFEICPALRIGCQQR